jgi:hypothetical protein
MQITGFFHHNFQNPGMGGFHNLKILKNLNQSFWNLKFFCKIETGDS